MNEIYRTRVQCLQMIYHVLKLVIDIDTQQIGLLINITSIVRELL